MELYKLCSFNNKKNRKRVGRGTSSGNGKTSGRGQKGQKSRSGSKRRIGFEGGQTPLFRRIPKRGFNNINKKKFYLINLNILNKFENNSEVNIKKLFKFGYIKSKKKKVKVLSTGILNKKLIIKLSKISNSARKRIEKLGGKIIGEK